MNTIRSRIIFLGTGTSSGVPHVTCVMKGKCKTCTDAIKLGSKNKRRNTSIIIQTTWLEHIGDEEIITNERIILVDCGKFFWEGALEWFPKYNIKSIDAVLITHAHADAFLGLDNLREFSKSSSIPIYMREQDLPTIKGAFPYIYDSSKAVGSGLVPNLQFITFDENQPLDILGLNITPLIVDHGPNYTALGFLFGNVAYISDCNNIPPKAMSLLEKQHLDVLILDALYPDISFSSHFSLEQCIEVMMKLRPKLGYATGMSHVIHHEEQSVYLETLSKGLGVDMKLSFDGLCIDIDL